jgi:hypothetical protein
MNPLADPANWGVVGATAGVIALVVGMHYEVLRASIRYLPNVSQHRRQRVVILIFVILVTHAVEIWIFAFAYYGLLKFEIFGAVVGSVPFVTLVDHAYFSGMVYTTVGFGDVVPSGPIRFMAGMEALTGLVMITWSASFTFLEMQRDWPSRG